MTGGAYDIPWEIAGDPRPDGSGAYVRGQGAVPSLDGGSTQVETAGEVTQRGILQTHGHARKGGVDLRGTEASLNLARISNC